MRKKIKVSKTPGQVAWEFWLSSKKLPELSWEGLAQAVIKHYLKERKSLQEEANHTAKAEPKD